MCRTLAKLSWFLVFFIPQFSDSTNFNESTFNAPFLFISYCDNAAIKNWGFWSGLFFKICTVNCYTLVPNPNFKCSSVRYSSKLCVETKCKDGMQTLWFFSLVHIQYIWFNHHCYLCTQLKKLSNSLCAISLM